MNDWRFWKGRHVVVTSSGVDYWGRVIELGEHNLVLQALSGYREIPWERITGIREDRSGGVPVRPPSALG